MSGDIKVFAFEGVEVRFVGTADAPEWVASDVCAALGLVNPRSSLALLPEDEKGVHVVDTLGGPQRVVSVTEPGLFRLILTSRRPEAELLTAWAAQQREHAEAKAARLAKALGAFGESARAGGVGLERLGVDRNGVAIWRAIFGAAAEVAVEAFQATPAGPLFVDRASRN